jgi:hypothetical protein
MAKITQEVQIKIDTAAAAQSVGDLRRAYKDLVSAQLEFGEGTEEFNAAAKAAGELKDRLAAVNDSVKSFSNSPIENLANSFQDLKTKVVNLDFGGVAQSFKNFATNAKLAAFSVLGITESMTLATVATRIFTLALAATGIGAIVIAVATLVTQFDDLSKSGGALGKVFTFIGDAVSAVKDSVVNLADAWGLVDKNATTANQAQIKAAEDTNARLRDLRTGLIKDEEERERTEAFNRRKAAEEGVTNATELYLIKLTYFKELADIEAKYDAGAKARRDKELADAQKLAEDKAKVIADFNAKEDKVDEENESNLAAKELAKLEAEKAAREAQLLRVQESNAADNATFEENLAIQLDAEKRASDEKIRLIEEEKAARSAAIDASLNAAASFAGAVQSLSNTIFANELANAKGNAVEEEKIRKKAFEANKGLGIVNAVISTAQAVISGFNAGASMGPAGVVMGPVMAALAGVTGAIQIAAIASSQYSPTGGGSRSTTPAPLGPAMPSVGSANQPIASFAAAGSGANLNTVGGGAPIVIENNVTISETQVTNAQTTVAGYQAGSELGGG